MPYYACFIFFVKITFINNYTSVSDRLDTDLTGLYVGLIWVHTICKFKVNSYQQMKKKLLLNLKDKDYCLIEIIKGLTDKGQF